MKEYLEIGQIVNTYGIKGFLKIVPYTDDPRRFDKLKTIYLEKNGKVEEVRIEEVKYHKNLVLLKLENVCSIEEAEKYKNSILKIKREDAVKLPQNSYFIVDLLGIDVYTEDNLHLGKIVDIFPTGSNDVYVVKDELGKQILLPAIKSVIHKVDIENKKMTVSLMEGLEK